MAVFPQLQFFRHQMLKLPLDSDLFTRVWLPAVNGMRPEVAVNLGIIPLLSKMFAVDCCLLRAPAHDNIEDVVEVS